LDVQIVDVVQAVCIHVYRDGGCLCSGSSAGVAQHPWPEFP
jgi:hypothetical protein